MDLINGLIHISAAMGMVAIALLYIHEKNKNAFLLKLFANNLKEPITLDWPLNYLKKLCKATGADWHCPLSEKTVRLTKIKTSSMKKLLQHYRVTKLEVHHQANKQNNNNRLFIELHIDGLSGYNGVEKNKLQDRNHWQAIEEDLKGDLKIPFTITVDLPQKI